MRLPLGFEPPDQRGDPLGRLEILPNQGVGIQSKVESLFEEGNQPEEIHGVEQILGNQLGLRRQIFVELIVVFPQPVEDAGQDLIVAGIGCDDYSSVALSAGFRRRPPILPVDSEARPA
ncbi:MAG TPA: hypothetical protein VGQ19_14200 [Burkholderiales bacterium]|jgi:hypothetical protein|nr:hypothetical protein [Burkholderiales bacterium]